MTGDSLNFEALDPDDFSGIFLLVLIGQKGALGVLVITGKPFQSILVFASIVACVLNLRFGLIMLFSAYKLNSASSSLIGSQTYTEFISSQYTNWICIVVGTVITIVIGILGIIKLVKNKKH